MRLKRKFSLTFFGLLILSAIILLGCSLTPEKYEPVLSDSPGSFESGRRYQREYEDKLKKAIEKYQEALDDPETADRARYQLAALFYEKGDYEKAIYHLESLEDDKGEDFLLLKTLGALPLPSPCLR